MPRRTEYFRVYIKAHKHRRRAQLIELLGGYCVRCGSTERLEFDHIDPTTKSFELGSDWTRAWDDLVAEARKCQLLCRPCHVAKGAEDRPEPAHGTYRYQYHRCRCSTCRAANAAASARQRARKLARSRADAPAPGTLDFGRSGVAQLAEHSAVNRIVVGSNPTAGANRGLSMIPRSSGRHRRPLTWRNVGPMGPVIKHLPVNSRTLCRLSYARLAGSRANGLGGAIVPAGWCRWIRVAHP